MKIELENHQASWAEEYEQLVKELAEALPNISCHFSHIGSTSIPSLVAKPIIDILIGVESIEQFDSVIQPLLNLGYLYIEKFKSQLPERLFFIKLKGEPEEINTLQINKEPDEIPVELHPYKYAHVHMVQYQSFNWQRHIAFRDYLKAHPQTLQDYAALKLKLSKKEWKDTPEYTSAKKDFVLHTEKIALAWQQQVKAVNLHE